MKIMIAMFSALVALGLVFWMGPTLVIVCVLITALSIWLSLRYTETNRVGPQQELRATAFHTSYVAQI